MKSHAMDFSRLCPHAKSYRVGLMALDTYAQSKFNGKFMDLTEDQQDQIVDDLTNDKADSFSSPSASDFFDMVRGDTINGFFSDPGYGGNTNMVGWTLIGYPGAQRAYTEAGHSHRGERPPAAKFSPDARGTSRSARQSERHSAAKRIKLVRQCDHANANQVLDEPLKF